jgi:hypothetical protein
MSGNDGEVSVSTDDKVFWWLNDGTQVRYATMTNPFEAKTKVGWLGSQVGVGGKLFVSKKHPRPGIEARKWDEALMEKYQNTPSFANGIVESLKSLFFSALQQIIRR